MTCVTVRPLRTCGVAGFARRKRRTGAGQKEDEEDAPEDDLLVLGRPLLGEREADEADELLVVRVGRRGRVGLPDARADLEDLAGAAGAVEEVADAPDLAARVARRDLAYMRGVSSGRPRARGAARADASPGGGACR